MNWVQYDEKILHEIVLYVYSKKGPAVQPPKKKMKMTSTSETVTVVTQAGRSLNESELNNELFGPDSSSSSFSQSQPSSSSQTQLSGKTAEVKYGSLKCSEIKLLCYHVYSTTGQ